MSKLADQLEDLAEQLNNPGYAICRKAAIRLREYERETSHLSQQEQNVLDRPH